MSPLVAVPYTAPTLAPVRAVSAAREWDPLPHMDEYLEQMRIEERSEEYLRPVKAGLSHFADFCHTQGVVHPEELNRTHILHFQAHLQKIVKADGEPYSPRYRQQILKYVRTWVNWLIDVGHIENTPWVRIKIGSTKKTPNPLEDEQVAQLFAAHRHTMRVVNPFEFHRREVILTLLFGWGLRVHELLALNASQMDARLEWVTVANKGGGTKTLPYSPELKAVVLRYLRVRPSRAVPGEDALVIGLEGQRLSYSSVRNIVADLGQQAGFKLHPHMLRDTMGTIMLDHDVELERVMKMLGHTQSATTLGYARVNDKKVGESHTRVMTPLLRQLLNEKETR